MIFMEPGEAILNITAIPLILGCRKYLSIDSYTFEPGTETTLEEQSVETPRTTTEDTLSTQTSQGGISTTTMALIGRDIVALAVGT